MSHAPPIPAPVTTSTMPSATVSSREERRVLIVHTMTHQYHGVLSGEDEQDETKDSREVEGGSEH